MFLSLSKIIVKARAAVSPEQKSLSISKKFCIDLEKIEEHPAKLFNRLRVAGQGCKMIALPFLEKPRDESWFSKDL